MEPLIISVSGLRGIVGENLSPDVASRYAAAYAERLPAGPVVLARDGRITGPMLCDAVRSTLTALGRRVLDADVAATPTVGILVRQHQAAGGIQVSASHNPPEYNGIKLFSSAGRVIDAAAGADVAALYRQGPSPKWVGHEQVGKCDRGFDAVSEHVRLALSVVDADRIRARGFHVLLDANHGAGAMAGAPLLAALGCRVTLLGATPDGFIEHPAEPTAKNLADVLDKVVEARADVGFCQDPDADRLAIIDEHGRYIGEEATLALCVAAELARRPGPIVVNCATSRMNDELARRYGVPCYHSKVGEANVVNRMLEVDAVLGGEGNGGVIDPRVVLVRDSIVGMALVLDALAASPGTMGQLADALPQYAMEKTKFFLEPEKTCAVFDALEGAFEDAIVDRADGLRLDWPDRWLLVRPSNTEPVVRAIAEAPTLAGARELCAKAGLIAASL